MYQVSDDYKLKMLDQVQTHRLVGSIDGHSFTDADVVAPSYTGQCADKKVSIGSVFIGSLKITFVRDILSSGNYNGKVIHISDGLLLGHDEDEEPIWEDVPVGKFYVSEAVWTAENMITVTAYDSLSLMDKPCEMDTSEGTVYDFCKFIELQTGVEFGMTEEECQALPNGIQYMSVYTENEIETYRDLLSSVAQMVGGFAYAGKDGKFYLKSFDNETVFSVPRNRRIQKAKYSDYTTLYDTISWVDVRLGQESLFGYGLGTKISLGPNPFLQYGSTDALLARKVNILNAVMRMRYNPFSVSMLPAMIALDLGDVVTFPLNYSDGTSKGAIMMMTWTYNQSVNLQCFGDNPSMTDAKSRDQKSSSSINKKVSENKLTYYQYVNVDPLEFGSEVETRIAKLKFTSVEKTTVMIFHEFIFDFLADLSSDCSYELRYYLDDVPVSYKPEERVGGISQLGSDDSEFTIARDLYYLLRDVTPNFTHTWEVRMITHGITKTEIDVNHIHITLQGQKLYGADYFAGVFEVEDEFRLFDFGFLEMLPMEDEAVIGHTTIPDYLLTESGNNICTENGDKLIL